MVVAVLTVEVVEVVIIFSSSSISRSISRSSSSSSSSISSRSFIVVVVVIISFKLNQHDHYYLCIFPRESPTVTVPDTITQWIGSGFCISSTTGFGISEPFSVTAYKPFFADYNLPYSVIRGEELELQINIFNYLEKCLPVRDNNTMSNS